MGSGKPTPTPNKVPNELAYKCSSQHRNATGPEKAPNIEHFAMPPPPTIVPRATPRTFFVYASPFRMLPLVFCVRALTNSVYARVLRP